MQRSTQSLTDTSLATYRRQQEETATTRLRDAISRPYVRNRPEHIAIAIEMGADVNAADPNDNGNTPLILAAQYRDSFIEMLLDAGANPNLSNNDGNTALHFLAERRSTNKAITLLITKQAKTQLRNHQGQTAEDIALWNKHLANARTLQQAESNPSLGADSGPVNFGKTPPADAIRPAPIRYTLLPPPQQLISFRDAFTQLPPGNSGTIASPDAYWRTRFSLPSSEQPLPGANKRKQPEPSARNPVHTDTAAPTNSWQKKIITSRKAAAAKGFSHK